ncbi:TetR/AcrR family transcriptional regulator [Marinomonas transparens]|uniref:TetR/AcrR family transcriptional regulator n=1 Tax=Marinomonas transparens TaxID=2795388 RepID=A0A934JTX0_9GAMM|nr:TetR/AcrR family transcriptional regulator [Marinomonas transparens]MBJ7537290.1 TetR/AcrR family transcriptional regulator [Marinomonas transparens]
MTIKIGRPKQSGTKQEPVRASLIEAAILCFSEYGFDKVSTRKVALAAGVDAAMIRYYFGSKTGLFSAAIQETLAPVLKQLQMDLSPNTPPNPLLLMQTYYRMIATSPMLPKLIQQVLNQPDNPQVFSILTGVIDNLLKRSEKWIDAFEQQHKINPNLNSEWVRLSFISLMIFPVLAPQYLQDQLGVKLKEDWLLDLANHNQTLLEQGLFTSPVIPVSNKNKGKLS